MKTLTLTKKQLIQMWKSQCSGVDVDAIFERTGIAST